MYPKLDQLYFRSLSGRINKLTLGRHEKKKRRKRLQNLIAARKATRKDEVEIKKFMY